MYELPMDDYPASDGRMRLQVFWGFLLLVYRGVSGAGVPFLIAWECLFLYTSLVLLISGRRG